MDDEAVQQLGALTQSPQPKVETEPKMLRPEPEQVVSAPPLNVPKGLTQV